RPHTSLGAGWRACDAPHTKARTPYATGAYHATDAAIRRYGDGGKSSDHDDASPSAPASPQVTPAPERPGHGRGGGDTHPGPRGRGVRDRPAIPECASMDVALLSGA